MTDQSNEYDFSMKVTGYHRVHVTADSYEEALEKANFETQEADFGALEDIDWEVSDVH